MVSVWILPFALSTTPANLSPIQDAIFKGSEAVTWRGTRGWAEREGFLENSGQNPEHLFTKEEFGDAHVHAEFKIPKGSNSGVYVQGRYEIQILDSTGKSTQDLRSSDCGSVYERWKDDKGYEGVPPLVNAFRGTDVWNTYDITFRAPRFDASGKKVENARFVEVRLNGILIQQNVQVTGPTRAAFFEDERATGPVVLQGDHGPVAYRNVWVRKL
jgi:hypothetical protein